MIPLPSHFFSLTPNPPHLSLFAVPLHFHHSSVFNFPTHCSYHHTISLFLSQREKFFFSPLSLYISIYRAPSSTSLSFHITLSFSWPFHLPLSHGENRTKSISRSLSLPQYRSLLRFPILAFCSVSLQVIEDHRKKNGII